MADLRHDPEAMRQHFEWVLPAGTAGCLQLDQRGGGESRSFHATADSLIAQVLAAPDARSDIGVNSRPESWAGQGYRECPEAAIEQVSAARIDVDVARPMAIATAELIEREVKKASEEIERDNAKRTKAGERLRPSKRPHGLLHHVDCSPARRKRCRRWQKPSSWNV
jgi:hypothetical protein